MTRQPKHFEEVFATLQLDEATLQIGHSETIVPKSLHDHAEPVDALRTLPRLQAGETPGATIDLELIGTLGEGGMGLVRLARQVALDRDVAVKTLRSNNPESAPKLLQEAYVTGRLEHPNIIPIYTLGRDDDGAPLIVMKRIEGVSWLEVLRDPDCMPGEDVDLLWHLETLLHLCNAVRYAHRHDVIHRDIKPENVMIGQFGEVYLLDWGIAVSIGDSRIGRSAVLPHRDEVRGMAGTPAYMAPEMTQDQATEHDPRTDIYLLGATLHEVLTNTPRHQGEQLFDVLRSAYENVPVDYPSEVPAELADIANRATATNKSDRFQTVEEFRAAVLGFIEHRGALALIGEAEQKLDHLASRMTSGADLDEYEVHDLFTEVRFACEQALRSWPNNRRGLETQTRYLRDRFAYAVRTENVSEARGLLAQLERAGEDVAQATAQLEELAAARKHAEQEIQGLRAFAADLDMSRGRFSRSLAMALMGVTWAADTIINWFMRRGVSNADIATSYVNGTLRVLAVGLIALFIFRKPLFKTTANRRLAYILVIVLAAILVFRMIFTISPHDIVATRALEVAMYGVAGMAGGLLADDRRIMWLGSIYFPLSMVTAYYGPQTSILLGFAHLAVFGGAGYFWTPKQLEKRIPI